MIRTALITGVTGQVGSYLGELLLRRGYRVIGLVRRRSSSVVAGPRPVASDVEVVEGDLLDQTWLENLLARYQPNEVYNLAAESFAPTCWERPVFISDFMALGVTRILEAVRAINPAIRVYQASSSEMFGLALESPQTEATPLRPRQLYAIAKAYGHWTVAAYRERYGLFACSGITYNHESPRRRPEFVTRKITAAVAKIKLGMARELALGNLEARRDWGFAGDYAEAIWRTLQQPAADDYVIATGETHSVRDWCEVAFTHVGLDYRDYVAQDPRFFRPDDCELVGSPEKARRVLGWQPTVGFTDLVRMMVDADLAALRNRSRG